MRNMVHSNLTKDEIRIFKRLTTPAKIQDFLDTIPINFEKHGETLFSPRCVFREYKAHCFEGALCAAAVLWFHGERPLIMNLESAEGDDDHVIALFKRYGCWGAITKTNHAVLRFREPVYKTVRELVMSFFHEYFLDDGKKTLRMYSDPLDLSKRRFKGWVTSEEGLWGINEAFDEGLYNPLINAMQIKNLRVADSIEIRAGKLVMWKKGR
ncbi:MAG: hypothetical protein NUV53_01110 [Patescibacteria group bacterium]|nr:hypothetical protein [Patescibacteria group bacterium]